MKITPQKYAQALAAALEESKDASLTMQNFLSMLRRRKQFRLLPKIVMAFEREWSTRKGIVRVDVAYPKKFESSVAELETSLSQKLGKTIQSHAKPSGTMIGGYRIKVDDVLVDGSLEGRLTKLAFSFNH